MFLTSFNIHFLCLFGMLCMFYIVAIGNLSGKCAKSFTLWQQATIELMRRNLSYLLVRATYIFFAHIPFVVNQTLTQRQRRGITLIGGLEGYVSKWKMWTFGGLAGCTKGRRLGRWAAQKGSPVGCRKKQPSGLLFSAGQLTVQPTGLSCSAACRPALLCSSPVRGKFMVVIWQHGPPAGPQFSVIQRRGWNNIPSCLQRTTPHWSHVLCVKAEPGTTVTPWSQHDFVVIGNPSGKCAKLPH